MGLWDDTRFEIGITEISFEIGIMDLKSSQIWIFHPCKLGLRDFTLLKLGLLHYASFEIEITGLQHPQMSSAPSEK